MKAIRNFALAHFLSGFCLFIVGWVWRLSDVVLFGIPLVFYLTALVLSWSPIRVEIKTLPRFPLAVLVSFLILNFLFCLLPPGEHIEADAMQYHLVIPWQYYLRGGVVPLDWSLNDKYPLYLQMAQLPFTVLTFPWIIKIWNLLALPALMVLAWNFGALLGYAKETRIWMLGFLSALVLFVIQYGTAMFDLLHLVYILLGVFYLVKGIQEENITEGIWGALFLGIACSFKTFFIYLALAWAAAFIVWKLFGGGGWKFRKRDWLFGFLPLLFGLVAMLPFMLRNSLMVGNPVFPLFANFFGTPIENKLIIEMMDYIHNRYGYGRSLLNFFLMPIQMILPARKFDYWVDPILLLFLFGFLVTFREQWRSFAGLVHGLALFIYIALFFISHQARFYYPFWFLVMLLGFPWFFQKVGKRGLTWVLIGQACLGISSFCYFHRDALAAIRQWPQRSYLENISFSYVWNKELVDPRTKLLCLRGAADPTVDLLYFQVPIKVIAQMTSLLPFEPKSGEGCDAFIIGPQWPRPHIFLPQGGGERVSQERFFQKVVKP